MRVAVLWPSLTGYFNTCLSTLAKSAEDLLVCYNLPESSAPHSREMFAWISNQLPYERAPDYDLLLRRLQEFRPDVILISSWHIKAFLRVAEEYRGKVPRILCMDNTWLGTPKQVGGVLGRRWLIRPYFDGAFVPGERTAQFARYLGFEQSRIFYGLYSANHDLYRCKEGDQRARDRTFIQVSRLVSIKGIQYLAEGYSYYRARSDAPWDLLMCGTGPQEERLRGQPGIVCKGFLAEADIARELQQAGCFMMASTFDPWPGAIHEAGCAGLPIICTTACGASVHLVQDGFNGFLVAPRKARELGEAMLRIDRMTEEQRAKFRAGSQLLSLQFTPERWADTVLRMGRDLRQA